MQNSSNNDQGMERPQIYSSSYGMASDPTALSTPVGQTSGPLPINTTSSGGHFFHRGIQQSPVFNPLISSQGQSLYNGVFGPQTRYTSQNSFSSAGFNNYSHGESHNPWISETRISSSVNNALQQADSDRSNRMQYNEKAMCNVQALTHTCCTGNKMGVSDNLGMCSPLSTDSYRTVTKEFASMHPKNNSLDAQSWFYNQGMIGYGTQQNHNASQANYKSSEQFSSCSVSQIPVNVSLQTQSEIKHSSDSNLTDTCFDHTQNHNSRSKPVNNCSSNDSVKPVCMEESKEQGTKYCHLQKLQHNGCVSHSLAGVAQQKQQEQNGYTSQSSVYSSAGELHEDTLYSQASLILQMGTGNDNSHNAGRFQPHYFPSKHSLPENHMGDINKSYTLSPVFQEHGRCGLDPGITCDMVETCLQADMKTVNDNTVNLQNSVSSSNSCCQLSVEATSSMNNDSQSVFGAHLQPQKSTVNCLSNCSDGMQLCSNSNTTQQLQIECIETGSKDNSNQESPSIAGESDIIVEETEEEMTESEISIEEIKGSVFRDEEVPTRCLVCSLPADSHSSGSQFVHMRGDSPVTSASHIPVVTKLAQVVANNHVQILKLHNEFICRRCFNLIDTVDCLETKLAAVKHDLIQLFETRLISLKDLENWKVNDNITDKVSKELENSEEILSKNQLEDASQNVNIGDLEEDINKCNKNEKVAEEKHKGRAISESSDNTDLKCNKTDGHYGDDDYAPDKEGKNGESIECSLLESTKSSDKYSCDVCSKIFSNKEYLNKHHQQQHTKQFSFYCDRCGKGFTLKRALENHLLLHSGEFRYQCEMCGKLFIQRYSLDDHLHKHEGRFRLTCQQCGKGFMCRNTLHIHMRTHTGERPFVCQHCGKCFSSSSNLVTHIRLCSGDLPFHCNRCEKGFALETQLKIHIQSKHDGQYRFKCSVCGKGFTKDSDRKVHARSHSGEKSYKCQVCGKCYSSLGNLNQHAKQHGTERPFKCSICGQGFLRRGTLAGHMNRHTGSKPFSCGQCNKSFAAKQNLHAHLKWHAGTIKRYTCTVCGKSFNHGLQVHMRIHSGHKPYVCSECGLAFTVRSTLNKHIKSKHQKATHFEKRC